MADFQLVLLPGLGADARMFEPQRAAFPQLHVPKWIDPQRGESLPDYAKRMTELVNVSAGRLFLGGSSFGGPVALEMARHLRPQGVLLIGSFRSSRSIPWRYSFLAKAGTFLPGPILSAGIKIAPFPGFLFGKLNSNQRSLLVTLMRDANPKFMQWGGGALVRWQGADYLKIPVHHIHGGDDRIIPCRRVKADVIVPGAGHFLNVTHAEAVNRFIAERATSEPTSTTCIPP